MFYAEVHVGTVARLREILLDLVHQRKPPSVIYLYIFSDGGCAYSGMCAYDIIRTCKIPVHTIIDGTALSAATYLSIAGTKRFILENANYMIHQISTEFTGRYSDMKVEWKSMKDMMDRSVNIYERHCHLSRNEIMDCMKRNTMMDAEACKQHGFIDEIITTSS